jgi:molybdate transport system substrate-binding protein
MMRSVVVFCALLSLAGCSPSKPQAVAVFAAVSTKEALEQIGRDFEVETGTQVNCNPAASSTLARQIEQGAGADVFLSADERWADYLADKGLVAERRDLLANRLVVVTPADRPMKLQNLADLASGDVKHLALALDPVPAGHYARASLKNAGVWDRVKDRVREAGDVRATLTIVTRGEAEAGLVYATDAATSDKVRVALEVPEDLHPPIRYPVVLVRRTGGSPAARAFYDFLGGAKAAAHFRKAGFRVLP